MSQPRKEVLVDGVLLNSRDHLILMGLQFVQMQVDAQARLFREASERTAEHQQSESEDARS